MTKAIILANHGPLTVGTTVESTVWWFITLDRSANAQLIAMAAGGPKRIDDENAAITYNQIGNELAGWFQAQPMFDRLFASSPTSWVAHPAGLSGHRSKWASSMRICEHFPR